MNRQLRRQRTTGADDEQARRFAAVGQSLNQIDG